MGDVLPVVTLLIGGALGAGLTWVVWRARSRQAEETAHAAAAAETAGLAADLRNRDAAIGDLRDRLETVGAQLKAAEEANTGLRVRAQELETEREQITKQAEEKLQLVVSARERLLDAFKALSADALQSNNESFLALAKTALGGFQESAKGDLESRQTAIDGLVKPVQESLKEVTVRLADVEKQRLEAYAGLREQVKGLGEAQAALRAETSSLVTALRRPEVRGQWGEMALRRVVEMAGMVDHVDFVEQLGTDTGDTRLRPDLIVKLPEDRLIAVDAKVPLAAYLQAVEATDEDTRQAKLKEHARLVRTQIQNLGRKSYAEHLEKAPDFVVLFLPMESLFSAALQQDPSLIEAGVDQNVVIATPTTLIGLLRAVAYGWRQERLAASAREISILGRELYERLATFVEHVTALGRGLGQATKAYNAAVGTLESRVLVSARKFDALGVSVSGKSLNGPPQLELLPRELRAAELAPPPGPPASGESLTEPAPHR